ncbi:DUF4062 domain-containing protein [Candidatus Magnetominusculus xianensis]|uniref:DUF4062 domain-containing protein n=1 Tax=Candidatus Magnetominusculus xianensis TaxID=1748249 RepID=A0ABR5SEM8_9BACT|nr:DUF4062 domain-containing protein [Candidatus Magnetominusculus xianensis]KWT82651.1 hypothetical protein ASN18_2407 [Candidatus Magnetominusculus xianensis]MBF0405338.1 DUF4062 domain-containing protein [Nitrospirota bacterium]
MAIPRIFISSTCYDLQEIRSQLRQFIDGMGYEPIMSEFGDIFYDSDKHVQDACKEEIPKSNIFVLIVGNNYGSLYYKHSDKTALPDSVTLQEFRKALELGIPKYIFLNRFVQYDFDNYRRALNEKIRRDITDNKIEEADDEKKRQLKKEQFDASYHFPHNAYRYIFYFLDIIQTLDTNNAVFPFESFDDIKKTLRKQWAGFFYDSLTRQRNIAVEKVELLGKRLDRIEHHLRTLAESSTASKDRNKSTIDIKEFTSEFNIAELEQMQEKIDDIISEIIYFDDGYRCKQRISFNKHFDLHLTSTWLFSLLTLIQTHKWSKFIPITEIFKGYDFIYWKDVADVPYKTLSELGSIFN